MDDVTFIVMRLFALAVAIPIHEFAHAASATLCGDDTPRRDGRLTIYPWTHFDPLGALCCIVSTIVGYGLGWGRPVIVNPANFRRPRWDYMWVAAWGPLSNLILAVLFSLPLRYHWVAPDDPLRVLFAVCIMVNLALMFFNLIPVYPLDGSKIVAALLPRDMAVRYDRFMSQWGMPILLLMVFTSGSLPILRWLVWTPMRGLLQVLVPGLFV